MAEGAVHDGGVFDEESGVAEEYVGGFVMELFVSPQDICVALLLRDPRGDLPWSALRHAVGVSLECGWEEEGVDQLADLGREA